MRRMLSLAAGLALSAVLLSAADLTGIWLGTLTGGRRNQVTDFAFQFVQSGNTLTGKVYTDYGSTPILKGTIEGDQISFQAMAREQNGNEILTAVLKFTGTIKDGEIELTKEREDVRAVGSTAQTFNRAQKQVVKLKRLTS
jgi:hypothetical protein